MTKPEPFPHSSSLSAFSSPPDTPVASPISSVDVLKKYSEPLPDSDDHGERKDEKEEAHKKSEVLEVSMNWKLSDISGAAVFNSNAPSQQRGSQNVNVKQHSSASPISNSVSEEDEVHRGEKVVSVFEWEPPSPQPQPPLPQAVGNTGKEICYSSEEKGKPVLLKNLKKIKWSEKFFAANYPCLISLLKPNLPYNDIHFTKYIPMEEAKELELRCIELERTKIQLNIKKSKLMCSLLKVMEVEHANDEF